MSPSRTTKGQTALEFIIMISMAIMIGMIFLLVVTSLIYDTSEERRRVALLDIGYMIQDELILAMTVEDGYVREFSIPEVADLFQYTLTVPAGGMTFSSVTLSSGTVIITFPLPEVSGALVKGKNKITKQGTVTIT